jgi:hypothetical protein
MQENSRRFGFDPELCKRTRDVSGSELVIREIAYELQDLRLQLAEPRRLSQAGMLAHCHCKLLASAFELHADHEVLFRDVHAEFALPCFELLQAIARYSSRE